MTQGDDRSGSVEPTSPAVFADDPRQGNEPWAPPRRKHLERRPVSQRQLALVVAFALLAAVAAVVFSSAAPTNTVWIDAVERALAAGLITVAASRARRWTLVVGAVVVTAASPWPQLLVGVLALFGTVFLVETRRRDRLLGALIGGFVAVLSMRLDVPGPTGVETLVALVATAPIVVSGYRRSSLVVRRIARRSLAVVAVFVVVTTALAAIAGVLSLGHLNTAVTQTETAVDLAGEGTGDESAAAFEEANNSFGAAQNTIGAAWASGARFIPIVGANLAAAQRAVDAGVELTDAGASLVSGAEFDTVQLDGGGVDLVALEEFAPRVVGASDALATATEKIDGSYSTWLVPQVRTRLDEVHERLGTVGSDADNAAVAVNGLPSLLGADGPRRYLFLFGNPAESRDMGGHIGNWAEVVADNGRIDLIEVGRPLELSMPDLSEEFAERYPASFTDMDPARSPQNLGATPDLALTAQVAGELFEASTGRAVDGVAYADVEAFAAMLDLAGDVEVQTPSGPVVLNSDNAVEFLTRSQYELFDSDEASGDALDAVIETTFDRLTTTKLPGPESLGELYAPLVNDGRFQFYSLHDDDVAMLDHFGLDGAVLDPDGQDLLGVFNRNVGPNKIDSFLERDVDTDITWDPTTGAVGSTVTVEVHNSAPTDLTNELIGGNITASPTGTNVTEVVVLSPFRLQSLSVDGLDTAPQPLREGDLWRYAVRVAVAPTATVTVQYRLVGRVVAGPEYRLRYIGQPLVNSGELSVNLEPLEGEIVSMSATKSVDSDDTDKGFGFRSSQAPDTDVTWLVEEST
ncbi:MAG: DUF4012 domain-containing protein [Microthrixaceae bacterium]|nr:DUF4012 domain-containing protein [Microthrixaceae bacterium]